MIDRAQFVDLKSRFIENFWGVRPFKRHSLVLLVAGVGYASTGVTYILSETTFSRKQALSVALSFMPMAFWGGLFISAGLLTIISSRWPPITETWGYMVLSALSAGWSATYTVGVISQHSPVSNLTGAFNWALLAFMWWAISGFVNPDRTIVVVVRDEGTTS